MIERDGFQGDEARFKKIFLVDFEKLDPDGYLRKREIVDLLHISNPQAIGGFGANFTFPFETIESVDLVTPSRLVIANDNNYPGSVGRHIQSGQPDDNEIILIEFGRALMSLEID